MTNAKFFQDFSKKYSPLGLRSLHAIGGAMKAQFVSMQARTLQALSLVTREEFDIQTERLAKAQQTLSQLNARIQQLEAKIQTTEHNGTL